MKRKILAALFMTVLLSCLGSKALAQRKKNVDIEIVGVAPDGNSLILNPAGDVPVYTGKKVRWFIGADASNVASFEIEKKEVDGSEQIFYFFDRPPGKRTRDGGGRVDLFKGEATYIYSIIWYDSAGTKHIFDPKISIDPTRFEILDIIIMAVIGVLPILGIGFLFRRVTRNRANRKINNRQR